MPNSITNSKELRTSLVKVYNDLDANLISNSKANTMAKVAIAVYSGVRTEMQHCIARGEKPEIEFLMNK